MVINTDYPWQGQVKLSIQETAGTAWQLRLRVPGWCSNPVVAINGQTIVSPRIEGGYLVLDRVWEPGDTVELELNMEASLIEPHPRIDAVRDSVAIQRGPIVYCIEAVDCADIDLMDIRIDETAPLQTAWHDDLGLMTIHSSGSVQENEDWHDRLYRRVSKHDSSPHRQVPLIAMPYYAWANRGANAMRVWIPRAGA